MSRYINTQLMMEKSTDREQGRSKLRKLKEFPTSPSIKINFHANDFSYGHKFADRFDMEENSYKMATKQVM